MTEVARPLYRACLMVVFAAALFTAGCAKKPVISGTPPPPTAAPSTPTVTLTAEPTSINKGDSATLHWSSTNATQLTIAPEVGAVAAEGSTKVTPTDSVTYTVTASGPGGSADSTVRITVAQPPAEPPPSNENESTLEQMFLKEMQDAYFDLDKADIRSDARAALGKSADFLRNHPQIKVVVEGHCDERGSTEYNLALGDRRAAAVKQYMVSLGIGAERISTVSYGKEKPFCMESNESCWQQNRRGHFVMAK
jgi:peptidoglycan-associated lipoprotein